jgi:hypothetical protein
MSRALFVRGTTALARDLALFIGRHRGESTPFLTNYFHGTLLAFHPGPGDAPSGFGWGFKAYAHDRE